MAGFCSDTIHGSLLGKDDERDDGQNNYDADSIPHELYLVPANPQEHPKSSEPHMTTGIWPTGDGRWCVVGELTWETRRAGSGAPIVVPDGFVTDLASIPRWLHWLINPFDPATAPAAIVHDWLLFDETEQRVAAGEFYRRLIYDAFPRWKAKAFFLAVLLFSTDV